MHTTFPNTSYSKHHSDYNTNYHYYEDKTETIYDDKAKTIYDEKAKTIYDKTKTIYEDKTETETSEANTFYATTMARLQLQPTATLVLERTDSTRKY